MSRARTALTAAFALTAAAAVAVPAAASTRVTSSTTAALAEAEVTASPTATPSDVTPTAVTTTPTTTRTPCPTYSLPARLAPGLTPLQETFDTSYPVVPWSQAGTSARPAAVASAGRVGSAGLSVKDLTAGPLSGEFGGYWNADGSFRVRVFARLAPGTPDTVVQMTILDEDGVQVGRVKKKLSGTAWAPLSKDYNPGFVPVELTCNGRVIASWNRSKAVTLEITPAQKSVTSPLGLQLDDLSVVYLGERPVKTTTIKITTPKTTKPKSTKPKSTKTRTKTRTTKSTAPRPTSSLPVSTSATSTP